MKSVSFVSLLFVAFAQLWVAVSANESLLAEALGLGLDLKEHIATLAREERLLEMASLASPTFAPTTEPTIQPTDAPFTVSSVMPTVQPTPVPTAAPTLQPTTAPTFSAAPTLVSTRAPTISSTRTPTVFPTRAPTFGTTPVIAFSSAIGLGGLSSPNLDTNAKNSVSQATCTTMNLPSSACSFWGSSATQTSRRMLRDVDTEAVYTVTAYINTTVSVPAGTSALSYYSSLTVSLTNTTALSANLQTAAADNGATSTLGSVSVTSVVPSSVTVSSPPTTSSSNKKNLSDGAIAGIVIGSVVGFALIAFALYYFCFRGASGFQAISDSNFNPRHQRKNNDLSITL